MDERIRFESKEESNARRLRAFLSLSPSERVDWFVRNAGHNAGTGAPAKGNFIIRKRGNALR